MLDDIDNLSIDEIINYLYKSDNYVKTINGIIILDKDNESDVDWYNNK